MKGESADEKQMYQITDRIKYILRIYTDLYLEYIQRLQKPAYNPTHKFRNYLIIYFTKIRIMNSYHNISGCQINYDS